MVDCRNLALSTAGRDFGHRSADGGDGGGANQKEKDRGWRVNWKGSAGRHPSGAWGWEKRCGMLVMTKEEKTAS